MLSIHGYSDAVTPAGEGAMERTLAETRAEIDRRAEKPVPIWVTEHTTFSISFLRRYWPRFESQRREHHYRGAAARVVREHVMARAGGIERFFYYWFWPAGEAYFLQNPVNGAMTEPTGAPKPMAVAIGILAWLAEDARGVEEVDVDRTRRRCVVFDVPERAVAVLWELCDDRTFEVPLPPDCVALDLMGNRRAAPVVLTCEPVYVRAATGMDARALAEAIRAGALRRGDGEETR